MCDDLLIGDAKEMHSGRRDVLARGGDTKKLPCVREVIRASDHDHVPFSDLVLNRVVEIRKRRVIQRYDLFMPLTTGRPIRRIGVIDVVRGEEYIYCGQVPWRIHNLLDPTTPEH